MYVCMYVCTYVCMYVYIYIYIYIEIYMNTDVCKKSTHFILQSLYFLRYVVETESQEKGYP